MTSHAAVVARGLGKPCVAGCSALEIDVEARTASIGDTVIREGDPLTIDGTTGRVILGLAPLVDPEPDANLATILEWADDARRLKVYANADTPLDAQRARENGAEGIGLCRTEHMFMAADRLPIVREMILGVDRSRTRGGAGTAPPDAAIGLRRHLRCDGGAAGDDPAARSAAARVSSGSRRGRGRSRSTADRSATRGEPDARDSRLSPRSRATRDLRDADPSDRACRPGRHSAERASSRSSRSCTRSWRSRPSSNGSSS